jgi:hypothetical protein
VDILEHTKGLREERMRLINEAKTVFDEAVEAKRAVTGEEQTKVDRLDERIAEIEAEVRTLDQRERRERESATSREAFDRIHGTTRVTDDKVSERRATEDFLRGRTHRSEGDHESGNRSAIQINWAPRAARFRRCAQARRPRTWPSCGRSCGTAARPAVRSSSR